MKTSKYFAFTGLLFIVFSFYLPVKNVHAKVITGIDEQAQLPFWEFKTPGISLRLVQRLPIQTRAFFLARGFNKQNANHIAQSCVFQTVFRNTSDHTPVSSALTYNLLDWDVIYKDSSRKMKVREEWEKEWLNKNIKKPQRLAFEWALYPTTQTYKPGDYNWGMSTFNLTPGEKFTLRISWKQYDKTHYAEINNIQCAEDINPQPEEPR